MAFAELNIATLRYPLDDPRVKDFVDNLDRVNAAAERMDGFVWRFVGDGNDATDVQAFDNPLTIVNLSVWQTVEHLEQFVWNTVHKRIYARGAEWFELATAHQFVMWQVEEGHTPSVEEAKERLEHLQAHGNSDYAFDWSHLEHVKLWQSQRCERAS